MARSQSEIFANCYFYAKDYKLTFSKPIYDKAFGNGVER